MFSERNIFRNKNSFKAKVVIYLMNVSTAFETFPSYSNIFVVGMNQGVNYSFMEVKFFTHLWACSCELTLHISSCSSASSYSLSWVWLRVSLAVFSSSPLSLSSFSRWLSCSSRLSSCRTNFMIRPLKQFGNKMELLVYSAMYLSCSSLSFHTLLGVGLHIPLTRIGKKYCWVQECEERWCV